jgi:hypothetical protein
MEAACDLPCMPTIDDEIRAETAAFVSDLTVLVRRLALEVVSSALDTGGTGRLTHAVPVPVTVTKRGVAKPAAKSEAPAQRARSKVAAPAPAAKKGAAPRRASGEKRPPAELARLTEKLGEYIKAHPGLRMEAIGKALGAPTRELNLPVKKLLAAKRIRSQGHKRATEYFPA